MYFLLISSEAEKSCIALKEVLSEVPDPSLTLVKMLDLQNLVGQNKILESKINEYRVEFKELTNQDVKIRALEDKLKDVESSQELIIQKKILEAKQESMIETERILSNYKDQEKFQGDAISNLKRENDDLKKLYDQGQNELYKMKKVLEETNSSQISQIDLLNEQVMRFERKIASMSQNGEAKVFETRDYQLECAQKDEEILRFGKVITSLKSELEEKKRENSLLEEKELGMTSQIHRLQSDLDNRPRVEEVLLLKERLAIIEELEFKNIDNASQKSIEQLLAEKVRMFESELAQTKYSLAQKINETESNRGLIMNLEDNTEKQRLLIEKLESDLSSHTNTTNSEQPQEKMVEIISEQRSRYKKRVDELEDEISIFEKAGLTNRQEIERLKNDNVGLYEKVRYLQNYRNKEVVIDIEEDNTYKRMYDENLKETLNPFNEFNRKEKDERYKDLSVAEKIMLQISRMMLSNRYIRLFMFIYFAALHLLTLMTMYSYIH